MYITGLLLQQLMIYTNNDCHDQEKKTVSQELILYDYLKVVLGGRVDETPISF